ncbi:Unconventional myosin [Seminavis robusta]|uniref:Unconventional myosin n=1 Tax=Seminavis robusta TaxID=568900 RepID=A0A9N8EGU5_9STRA|nr:Unconventional myosin [Seminavis robusta]|eukprot:Sro1108_g242170.1 Unconventional myosin (1214) ;mRNA; f:11122-14954
MEKIPPRLTSNPILPQESSEAGVVTSVLFSFSPLAIKTRQDSNARPLPQADVASTLVAGVEQSKRITKPKSICTIAVQLTTTTKQNMPANTKKDDPMPFVYVRSKDHAWVPARVLESDGKVATVIVQKYKNEEEMLLNAAKTAGITVQQQVVQLKDYDSGVLPMQNVDDRGKLGDFEDMVNLPYLHEAAILYNIKNRHMKGLPYTRTGDMIVAVNPYKWFDHLYTEKQRKTYAKKLVWDNSESDPRNYLSPHVYETSALAYKGMSFDKQNQSILVSGESGAGKTETVKICMNHLANVQEGPTTGSSSSTKDSSLIVQRVLDSNPLLEAFGNAQTRRNDNSSRFGKYTQLQFDRRGEVGRPVAKLAGSICEPYLLEKNRVINHDSQERTFHIFYQLLAAPEDAKACVWSGLKGKRNADFKYVGATQTTMIEGVSDGDQFLRTTKVLSLIGLGDKVIREFLRALCVVLQLGNLTFGAPGGDADKSECISSKELAGLAKLMDLPESDLSVALTERTMKTKDESYKVPLDPAMARDSADALAKEIYGKLFLWLVNAINKATSAEANYSGGKNKNFGIIGLLDIFGFESFEVNRFEQLCINYANEKLQQKFTEDIFRSVQAEYKMEGVPLAEIKYDDNTDVLDLIEGRTGLCAMLNEECVRPKGSGFGFVNKALAGNRKSPCLVPDMTDRMCFGIKHYAGKVFYNAENFVASNQDTLPTDLQDCASKCSNRLICAAFQEEPDEMPRRGSSKETPKRLRSNIMAPTVWTKYKGQLSHLMTNLRSTNSRYIRCIKPNTLKKPGLMEHNTTVEQLRYAGIVAGVTISRSAFPNRLSNTVVYARYNGMWEKRQYPSVKSRSMSIAEQVKADCEAVLTCALKTKESLEKGGRTVKAFVVGKTRTYFRAGALEYLESQRITGLDAQATAIQKAIRGWLIRKDQIKAAKKKVEDAALAIQAEKERKERLAREKKEREARHLQEMKGYYLEIQALKKRLQEADEDGTRRVEAAKRREEQARQQRDELQSKVHDHDNKTKSEMERLKIRYAANLKLIQQLKKENKKAHKALGKDESIWKDADKRYKRLSHINHESATTFDGLEGDASSVAASNQRLLDKREEALEVNMNLKDKVRKLQSQYMDVAEQRLELQKTMAKILNTIQDGCKDKTLVEHVFCVGHECETESKCLIAKLEIEEAPYDLVMSDTSDSTRLSSSMDLSQISLKYV